MNFTNKSKLEYSNITIEWKYFILPLPDGRFNSSDLKYILFPLVNFYYFYFLLKLVMKYKAKLEPVHIFELNTMGNLLGNSMTTMIINYDPYFCDNLIYNCEIIHFINYLSYQSLSFDLAIGKNNCK